METLPTQYNNYTNGKTEGYAQLEVKELYQKELFKRVNLSQSLSYQVSLKNIKNYFIHFKASLNLPIAYPLALSITYLIDYQNLLCGGASYHTDKTLLLGVNYSF
ncbi:DUF481 domain-containing protein [Thermovibrio sp.]